MATKVPTPRTVPRAVSTERAGRWSMPARASANRSRRRWREGTTRFEGAAGSRWGSRSSSGLTWWSPGWPRSGGRHGWRRSSRRARWSGRRGRGCAGWAGSQGVLGLGEGVFGGGDAVLRGLEGLAVVFAGGGRVISEGPVERRHGGPGIGAEGAGLVGAGLVAEPRERGLELFDVASPAAGFEVAVDRGSPGSTNTGRPETSMRIWPALRTSPVLTRMPVTTGLCRQCPCRSRPRRGGRRPRFGRRRPGRAGPWCR
ncbi:hypothetical protein ABIA38_005324 [Embleya sp. AB8]